MRNHCIIIGNVVHVEVSSTDSAVLRWLPWLPWLPWLLAGTEPFGSYFDHLHAVDVHARWFFLI